MMHWRVPRRRLINAQDALRGARCDLPVRSVTLRFLSLAAIVLAALLWVCICWLIGAL